LPPKLSNGDDGAIGAGAGFGAGFFFFVAGIAFFIFFVAGIAFFIPFFLRGRAPRFAFLDFFATFNLQVGSTKITLIRHHAAAAP
jgi:hypothetical protein